MLIEINEEQQQILTQLVDGTQFPGAASEKITDLKKALRTPLTREETDKIFSRGVDFGVELGKGIKEEEIKEEKKDE